MYEIKSTSSLGDYAIIEDSGFYARFPFESDAIRVQKLLIKDTPMVPFHVDVNPKRWVCPTCEETILYSGKFYCPSQIKHCIQCGQLLDWEKAQNDARKLLRKVEK